MIKSNISALLTHLTPKTFVLPFEEYLVTIYKYTHLDWLLRNKCGTNYELVT